MQKNRKNIIIFGIAANIMFGGLFALMPIKYYQGWDTIKKIYPDKWLATDEDLLHVVYYYAFPAAAVVMIVSAVLFWKLRK
jgi:hypothetical protein